MTAPMLESYVAGRWFAATDEGDAGRRRGHRRDRRPRRAAPASTCRRCSTTPATVGGPALRELTFHQRAGLLKQLAPAPDGGQGRVLRALAPHRRHRPRLAVDIDGGFGTLLSYASKATPRAARRHRRARRRRSSRWASAARSSASTSTRSLPRRGGADQRLQLPGLGHAREARARLPGRRARPIVKPASQTAYLTEAVVRRIVESGLLPEGSLQLLSGSAAGAARPARPARTRSRSPARPHTAAHAAQHTRRGARTAVRVQRRGRLAQLLGARPRRHARRPRSSTCSSSSWSPR